MNNIVLEQVIKPVLKLEDLHPLKDEKPSGFAERLGLFYSSEVTPKHKKKFGQYLTNNQISGFMAKLSNVNKAKVKVLDPGCGTAVLSCALSEHLVNNSDKLKELEITLYETDSEIIPFLEMSLIYLKDWLSNQKIKLDYNIVKKDFILENHLALENNELTLFEQKKDSFDIIISNPPYFKISKSDPRAEFAKSIVHGQPNMYSIFFAISANLLAHDGELIFIIPRSFTSGYYFRLFRERIFSIVHPTYIHLFISRKEAFENDGILQENIIIKAKRISDLSENKITLSSSNGLKDIYSPLVKEHIFNELIDLKSYHKILYLPSSDKEEAAMKIFKSWLGSLNHYNIQISTGPVVPFRSKDFIFEGIENENIFAPLFWMHNILKMEVKYPLAKANKGQYIKVFSKSLPILLKNKNYILMRRFSSKDDQRRLIATPYFADFTNSEYVGVENHLNYIYRPNGELDKSEILGLSTLLNSSLFDTYFRTFSGNTQVSATELREIPLPSLEKIIEIGKKLALCKDFNQAVIDNTVKEILEINDQD